MTDLLSELEALKETLAMMAKYAPAHGVICAPTMEMGLGWKAQSLLAKIDKHHAEIAAAVRDKQRIDFLQREVNEIGAFLLHNGKGRGSGFTGLGLQNTGRTLRQAIDQCLEADTAMRAGEGEG